MPRPKEPATFRSAVGGGTVEGDIWRAGEVVAVLLHPGVANRRCWHELVPHLPEDLTVIAYDCRGYGTSPATVDSFTHLHDLIAILEDLVGIKPVWLVGSSFGGGIALDAAAEFKERVLGLVLISPAISGAPEPSFDPATRRLVDEVEACVAARQMDGVEADVRIWLDGLGPGGE